MVEESKVIEIKEEMKEKNDKVKSSEKNAGRKEDEGTRG